MEKHLKDNVMMARQIVRVLYSVVDSFAWNDISEELITRLLTIFRLSILPSPSMTEEVSYMPIRRGFEVLLRRMFENFPNPFLLMAVRWF